MAALNIIFFLYKVFVSFFGRPFVKRFAQCYRSVVCLSVCPVLSVYDVGVLWPNGWMDQDKTWCVGRPRPRPHCVRRGPSSSSSNGHSPQFSAHVCCDQTAGWIKKPLGTEVGLSPGDIVLGGVAASSPKKEHSHQLVKCLWWRNGYIDQDVTWYGGRPQPRAYCVRWGSSSTKKGLSPSPQFSASVCCGQTVAHLSYC